MTPQIKALCAFAICSLLSLFIYLINFGRKNRKYQLALPFTAGIYSAIATVLLLVNKSQIIEEINKLGLAPDEKLKKLDYIYSVDKLVNSDIFLFNAAIITGYFIVKLITLIVVRALSDKTLNEKTENAVYCFDSENNAWFLKEEWVYLRSVLNWLSLGCAALFSVFSAITCYTGHDHPLWIYFVFAFPLLTVFEIANYYNGYTREEFLHSVFGVDSVSQQISNFHKLRLLYEVLFPNELLAATTSNEHLIKESGNEIIEALKKSEDSVERVTGEFFDSNDRNHYDPDSLLAGVNLVKNQNVVFFNPFYRDLSDYIVLPLINALLSSAKCLVITGRNSLFSDVESWLKEIIKEYTRMESMWRIKKLTHNEPDCEIGILSSSSLYDLNVIKANSGFFAETKFIIFIEPSLIINTSQISLSIISQMINDNSNTANFCVFDKQTDGLVDTLSHIMKQEIVNVVAPPVPDGAYTAMAWDSDGDYLRQNLFDKQTRFFGNGIELAAVAIKNQIPKVTWYSESKAPVKDIKWIASQYYPTLCKYMNIPSQQKSLQEKIEFKSNLWSAERERDCFVIAEDEFNNFFITLRAFLSRGISQSFVNVFSENYLLRDYMRCNTGMFLSNPNSIPSLVPDYSKTERNLIIKLLLMMSINEVEESVIQKEFRLVNIETDNVLRTLYSLISKYTYSDEQILSIRSEDSEIGEMDARTYYSVSREVFDDRFADSLKTAYYIVENEENEQEYLDSKLFGHITQVLLPDQFITYDGKYYKVKYISSDSGVILRRASDLYDNNRYYRQLRKYHINSVNSIESEKTVNDIEIITLQCDFDVETNGYIQLNDNHDLRSASVVTFGMKSDTEKFKRQYKNKSILKIKLPDTDDRIRFTAALLLSEVFKSVYPNSWQYIAVLAAIPDDIDGMLNHMVYSVDMDVEDEYIYIIEDSYIDLGLLDSVEKNLFRFFEIIADFLDWHEEKMREPEREDPIPRGINFASQEEEEKKRSRFSEMARRIRNLFVRDKDVTDVDAEIQKIDFGRDGNQITENAFEDTEPSQNDNSADNNEPYSFEDGDNTVEDSLDEIGKESYAQGQYELTDNGGENSYSDEEYEQIAGAAVSEIDEAPSKNGAAEHQFTDEDYIPEGEDAEISSVDGTDIFDNDGTPDDYLLELQFDALGITPVKKTRYQKECYLKFGFEEIDARLKIDEVKSYFRVHGWSNNHLTMARKRDVLANNFIDFNSENHCDFCGMPLSGISYERLNDGRIRCNHCSSSTISKVDQVEELFYQVLNMLGSVFDIKYTVPISLEMADARTVAKGAGSIFRPSTGVAQRVLGYAKKSKDRYSLVIENGSPKLAAIDTMVHELTHIWQYTNWKEADLAAIYQMPNFECPEKSTCDRLAALIVYEGMAIWTAIQYLYQMGETYYASEQEAIAEARRDIYGVGFRMYRDQYPLVKDGSAIKYSPFLEFPTIDPDLVIDIVKQVCTNNDHSC